MSDLKRGTTTQKAAIAATFAAKAYTPIAPGIIQEAEPFLDLSGEEIRSRIYVFTDPHGHELCLRPDLTIPACLHYLQDVAKGVTKDAETRRYAYEGLAFRCQEPGSSKPNEFSQSGIELIGQASGTAADAEVFSLTLGACRVAGLDNVTIRLGDLGLFAAFIEALDIPQHWRERLRRNFWQPSQFGALLSQLAKKRAAPEGVAAVLAKQNEADALQTVNGLLDLAGLESVPGRSAESVARRLMQKARDASAEPVSPQIVASIEEYLKISGAPKEAMNKVRSLAEKYNIDISTALGEAQKRLDLIEQEGVFLEHAVFATEFGRSFEYYTGFVFELTSGTGPDSQIAGGGRYDDLLLRLGAPGRVPAVGAMIRNDRLAHALEQSGDRS